MGDAASKPWSDLLGGLEGGGALGDRRLPVRGLVLVDDALADGLVELARRDLEGDDRVIDVALVGGLAELADRGLQGRLDGLVAQPVLLVLTVALDLGLDVRHEESLGMKSGSDGARGLVRGRA